jgi:hypothetical protein
LQGRLWKPRHLCDTSYDFQCDSDGRDPDKYSKTLRRYHQLLRSKPLPAGGHLTLSDQTSGKYLHHKCDQREVFLSSDSVIPSYLKAYVRRMRSTIEDVGIEEVTAFRNAAYTIGGMLVFPSNSVNRAWTLNQARGCTGSIADRLDLTLECIRMYYEKELGSPLETVVNRYATFFDLFKNFDGYLTFFHLQDILGADGRIRFFTDETPFTGGAPASAFPVGADVYRQYMARCLEFLGQRNARISQLGL